MTPLLTSGNSGFLRRLQSRDTAGTVERAAMLVVGLLLVGEAVVLPLQLAGRSTPYDDAFITFRYAQNWAEGRGFTYNMGDDYLGTTSPAYALLLGVLVKIFARSPELFANWLSAFALTGGAWYVFRLVLKDFGLLAALTAGASLALNPMLISTWGGEWLLAMTGMAAGFYYYRERRLMASAAWFSLAILFRSEAVLGVAPVFGVLLWQERPAAARAIGFSAAIGLAWIIIALVVVGHVLPSTLSTKLAHGRSGLFPDLRWGLSFTARLFIGADWRMGLIVLLAWHGVLLGVLRGAVWQLMFLWIGVHVLFYVVLAMPFYHWYLVPVAFGLSVATGIGVAAVSGFLHALLPSTAARYLTPVAAVALLMTTAASEAGSSWAWVRSKPDPRERLYNRIGAWLSENTAADASVAYLEIGRIGYFSQRRIIDLMGLVTPAVADHVANQDLLWSIHEYKPDYYLRGSAFVWAGSPVDEPWFAGAYAKAIDFSEPELGWLVTVYRLQPNAEIPPAPFVEALQLRGGVTTGELLPARSEGQTFLAGHDSLNGVAVNLATFARINHGQVRFRLEAIEPAQEIHHEVFEMADVRDNSWRLFTFPPVAQSAGRRFRLTLEAIDARPGNAITIHASPRDLYDGGDRLTNGRPAAGDLLLQLFYPPRS